MALTVEFSDLQAAFHCPLAAASGYDPIPVLPDEALSRKALVEWPSNTEPLREIVNSLRPAARWMNRTRFSMAGDHRYPPAPAREGARWLSETTGRASLSISGETITAKCRLPYLHRINDVWEVVYCYTGPKPLDLTRRSDLITRASWDQSVFRYITGEKLFARFLAPAYRHEERLSVPDTTVRGAVAHVLSLSGAPVPTPGLHCNDIKPEGNSTTGHHWQCPVRESGSCSAVQSWTAGNTSSVNL